MAAAVLAIAVLPGCGDNPDERAVQLGDALRAVDGVTSVETSTPSGLFVDDVRATAFVDGPIDRATFERVAQAYRAYLEEEDHGFFSAPAETWIEGPAGRAPVPAEPDDARLVGGWVEALADPAAEVLRYEIMGGPNHDISLTTPEPLTTAQHYAVGPHALAPAPGGRGTLTAAVTAGEDDRPVGITSLQVVLGAPETAEMLSAVGRADTSAQSVGPAALDLAHGTLTVRAKGETLDEVLDRHESVAEAACPDVVLTTISGSFSASGCEDLTPVRDLVEALPDVDLRAFNGSTDTSREQVVEVDGVEDLLDVAAADIGPLPVLLRAGPVSATVMSVAGRPSDVRALAPAAAAASGDGRRVIARRAVDTDDVDISIRGQIDDPHALFRAMRDASWDGELVFGLESYGDGDARSHVRWRSTATGTAQDVGPLRGDASEKQMGEATKALVAAWDATAG